MQRQFATQICTRAGMPMHQEMETDFAACGAAKFPIYIQCFAQFRLACGGVTVLQGCKGMKRQEIINIFCSSLTKTFNPQSALRDSGAHMEPSP
mmetsp:Transcript_141201/g.246190  ORF Transcript_141201/g.246190 Transcript_141201/m.246190 type:complete len:94 (+) Transcript_141201:1086-1367(+)